MRPYVEQDVVELPDAETLADSLTLHTCLRNCFGNRDMAGSCCMVGDRDYIIGPIPDAQALLERLNATRDRAYTFDEVFITYEEGRALFPEKPCWQDEKCFPALRLDMESPDRPCQFYGDNNLCTIHDIRSVTCQSYHCPHLTELLKAL